MISGAAILEIQHVILNEGIIVVLIQEQLVWQDKTYRIEFLGAVLKVGRSQGEGVLNNTWLISLFLEGLLDEYQGCPLVHSAI